MKKIKLCLGLLPILFSINSFSQEKSDHGVTFTINQIEKKSVGAFYLGRNFEMEQIEPYANSCVYSTTLRNDNTENSIHYLRKNWVVKKDAKSYYIKTNEQWLKAFKKSNISASSWIAFRLAQMPEEQIYEANGDWNQGMLSVDLPLGSKFDLTVIWDIKGKPYELTVHDVECIK
jgi:hypothetical protein